MDGFDLASLGSFYSEKGAAGLDNQFSIILYGHDAPRGRADGVHWLQKRHNRLHDVGRI